MSMPNLNDKSFVEKYLKYFLLALGGFAVFWWWKDVAPIFAETAALTLKGIIYLIITAVIVGFIWYKPTFLINTYKNICNHIENFWVTKDPLSYMDRYIEYLGVKMQSLNTSIVTLSGKKEKLKRKLEELVEKIESHKKLGAAAMKLGDKNAASLYGTKLSRDMESIELFTPMYKKMEKYVDFMTKLYENWKYSREGLTYQVQSKRDEFEMFKETVKGLKSAEDLINSDSEQAQLYGKSIKALEENVTQKIAYIEDFEKRSKDIILNISLEKQVAEDEGLAVLEQYMGDSNVFLPDFSKANFQDIEYEEVGGKKAAANFNLLK